MKKILFFLIYIYIQGILYSLEANQYQKIIERGYSESITWESRNKLAELIKTIPSEEALPLIFNEKIKVYNRLNPAGFITGFIPDDSSSIEVIYQIYWFDDKIWKFHLKKNPKSKTGKILFNLIQNSNDSIEKNFLLQDLKYFWTNEAEIYIVNILNKYDEDGEVLCHSADLLIINYGNKYHSKILDLISGTLGRTQWHLFSLLATNSYRSKYGFDTNVVCIGFNIIENDNLNITAVQKKFTNPKATLTVQNFLMV